MTRLRDFGLCILLIDIQPLRFIFTYRNTLGDGKCATNVLVVYQLRDPMELISTHLKIHFLHNKKEIKIIPRVELLLKTLMDLCFFQIQ